MPQNYGGKKKRRITMKIEIIYFRNGDIFEYAMREIQALKLKGVHIIKKILFQ